MSAEGTVHRIFEAQDHPNLLWWMDEAACAGMDPDLFFPERGGSTREAKDTCRRCPVMAECRAYGMTQRFGIWGGLSERERRRIRIARRAAQRGSAA